MPGSISGDTMRGQLLEQQIATGSGELLTFGASYKTADLQFRERLAKLVASGGQRDLQSLPGVRESALLSTCNRLEMYLVADSAASASLKMTDYLRNAFPADDVGAKVYFSSGPAVIVHLFRVAAGLESVVLGEPQILAQVRGAGISSRKARTAKGILSPLFDRAFRVGSHVRTAYKIGSGEASLSDLAVEVTRESTVENPKVLLIGTGKMVQLAARRLQGRASRFYVASKRKDVPKGLAGSTLVPYADIPRVARKCDVVISATAVSRPLLSAADFRGAKRHIVVDLGMPRNVSGSVRNLPNVRLVDLDDLARTGRQPGDAVRLRAAEAAVVREASEFHSWLVQTRLSSTVSELFAWANGIRDEEVRRAARKMGQSDPRERHVAEAMARRIVSKLMARPVKFAKGKNGRLTEEERLDLLRSVFGIGDGNEDVAASRE